MSALKYLFIWPMANIRTRRWSSTVMVLSVALATYLVTSTHWFCFWL